MVGENKSTIWHNPEQVKREIAIAEANKAATQGPEVNAQSNLKIGEP